MGGAGQLVRVLRVMVSGSVVVLEVCPTRSDPVAIWNRVRLRKPTVCWLTGAPLAVGDEALAPLGNQDYRGRRIALGALRELGWRSGRAVMVLEDGSEVEERAVMVRVHDLEGDSMRVETTEAFWEFLSGMVRVLIYVDWDGEEIPVIEFPLEEAGLSEGMNFHIG